MKKLLNGIFAWLIGQGADKWLHVIAGMVIAQLAMLLPMTLMVRCVSALVAVYIVEICKETLLDARLDWVDVAFTMVGGALGVGLALLMMICL